MAQKRTLTVLTERMNAAYAEYLKYKGMIEFFETDPIFASTIARAKLKTMNGAKALASANGSAPSPKYRASWTPERRAARAALTRASNLRRAAGKEKKGKGANNARRAKQSAATRNVWANKTPAQRKAWVKAIAVAKAAKAANKAAAAVVE